MEIDYIGKAIEDIEFWKSSGKRITQKRISKLLTAISQKPYTGIGKPEQLKYELHGY